MTSSQSEPVVPLELVFDLVFVFAFTQVTTLLTRDPTWGGVLRAGLVDGVALYLVAHVAFRLRIRGGLGRGRPIACLVLLALLPVAIHVPAAAALGMVAAVCVALIVYEVVRHRESRARIRSRRGALSTNDLDQFEGE